MRIPGRAPKLPDDVAKDLGLAPRERVLAWSALAGGGYSAATVAGLHLLTPRGELIVRGWVEVDRAAWDGPSQTLGVWWVGTRSSTPLELLDASRLPVVIRERVQSSVVLTATVPVGAGRDIRLALRRAPSGEMTTQVIAPPGVDLADAAVAAVVAEGLADLRSDAGVGPDDVVPKHPQAFGTL